MRHWKKNLHMLGHTPDNIQTSLATAIQIFNKKTRRTLQTEE